MRAKGDKKKGGSVTIIRREDAGEHAGDHGGAWKVAYADFVTAMMAFFLLMWLMNATTEDQRKGLADYFSPTNLMSHNSSGTGQPFGGHTAFDSGAMLSDRGSVQITEGRRPVLTDAVQEENDTPDATQPAAAAKPSVNPTNPTAGAQPASGAPSAPGATATAPSPHATVPPPKPAAPDAQEAARQAEQEARKAREAQALQGAAEEIRRAVMNDKALAGMTEHLAIDITPEGLRIQILDTQKQAMFATGSTQPNEAARALLAHIAPVLAHLTEKVAIDGHTDSAPYPGTAMTNWELSAGRANAARRLLVEAGFPEHRIRDVSGHADRDLLLPADPFAAANRRISILVLRGTGTDPPPRPTAGP